MAALRAVRRAAERVYGSRGAAALAILVSMASMALAVYVEVGQINLTRCLAAYNERAAVVSAARARVATEDRALDQSDRAAQDRAEAAMDLLLDALNASPPASLASRRAAFAHLDRVRDASAATRARNKVLRQRHDEERSRNPIPDPPSERCG